MPDYEKKPDEAVVTWGELRRAADALVDFSGAMSVASGLITSKNDEAFEKAMAEVKKAGRALNTSLGVELVTGLPDE